MNNKMVRTSKDTSAYSAVHPVGVAKRTMYKWSDPGDKPIIRWIEKGDLLLSEEYQRDASTKQRVHNIASDFSWSKFCPLAVSQDNKGRLWVIDGGHRLRAVLMRDDIASIPCSVTQSNGLEYEARIFADQAKARKPVGSYDRFKALVVARDKTAMAVNELLIKNGYSAWSNTDKKYTFQALGALTKMINRDPSLAEAVFGFVADMANDGERIPRPMLTGIFHLQEVIGNKDDVLSKKNADKLRAYGIKGLSAAIKQECIILGKGGERVWAKAILDVINKGRRSIRLSVNSWK